MQLWTKTLIGIALGVFVGVFFSKEAILLQPIGEMFLRLISCLIIPLVFASIVNGVTSVTSCQLGRIGLYTLFLYLFTTIFAIFLGYLLPTLCPIGTSLSLDGLIPTQSPAITKTVDLTNVLVSLVPNNLFKALYEQNLIQIMILSLAFGIGLNLCPKQSALMKDGVQSLSTIMQKLALMLMSFSPIAVFALMAASISTMGVRSLLPLLYFLLLYYIAVFLHMALIFCGLLIGIARLNPKHFFKGMKDTFATTISTCSSSASLPMCIENVTSLGADRRLSGFILPLCSTLNMNGSALYQMMAALFIAQASGIHLSSHEIVTLIGTVFLATMGTAHIPGGGFIMLSVVFTSIGLPLESLALLAGIDRLRDMATTTLNIFGDAICTLLVAKREGQLDETKYYNKALVVP